MKNRYLISTVNEICFPMHKMAFVSGVKFFGLKRLLDIVRQGNELLQIIRFRELVETVEGIVSIMNLS